MQNRSVGPPLKKLLQKKNKATKQQESITKAQKNHHMAVAWVAQLKDAIRWEDKAYPIITSERSSHNWRIPVTISCDSDYDDPDMSNSGTAPEGNAQDPR